ncbi:hypothetical protein P615_13980 [Brevibacillus laterosporus PE36]|nr:hypothetical protein P615_13980 [Brevibacillus laterosporus PE36]
MQLQLKCPVWAWWTSLQKFPQVSSPRESMKDEHNLIVKLFIKFGCSYLEQIGTSLEKEREK